MKLWLLRHARVLLQGGLCYGASDVPADHALTVSAAQAMAPLLPQGLPWWVSDLARARQMAFALRDLRPDLGNWVSEPRLREMNFGAWELKPWDAVPRAVFDAWTADFALHRFGGVESVDTLIGRVADALQATRERVGPHGQALWVTHAGVIRSAQFLAQYGRRRIASVSEWPKEAPRTGEWMVLDF